MSKDNLPVKPDRGIIDVHFETDGDPVISNAGGDFADLLWSPGGDTTKIVVPSPDGGNDLIIRYEKGAKCWLIFQDVNGHEIPVSRVGNTY